MDWILRNYTKINDMMIPKEIESDWNLSTYEFSYAKFKITEYNDHQFVKKRLFAIKLSIHV